MTTIADTYIVPYPEALTTATAYAIQLGVDTGTQEGGQAPGGGPPRRTGRTFWRRSMFGTTSRAEQ